MSDRRYLFLINSLLPGGAERSLVELLPRLVAAGVAPTLVCLYRPEISLESEVREAGLDLRFVDEKRLVSRVRAVRRIIRDVQPGLVHTTLFDADIVGRLAAAGTGIPVMSTLANATYEKERIDADANLRKSRVGLVRIIDGFTARHFAKHFHAVSHAVKESSVRALRVDPSAITVVYRGRDAERLGLRSVLRREATRNALGLAKGAEMILTVGRQEYQKGQEHLIRAFMLIAGTRPQARLMIAGRPGNATSSLVSLVEGSGLSGRIEFLGHREDVADLMVAADVFVFPSLWEGLGGALIEALALEVPIVASDLAPLREVVVDGENGLLVPPGDVGAISSAVSLLLDEPAVALALTAANRSRFESMFGIEDCSMQMVQLLDGAAK